MKLTKTVREKIKVLQSVVENIDAGKGLNLRQKSLLQLVQDDSIKGLYDTIKVCSKATGIPMKVLSRAKELGCTAFRNQRVHLGEFLEWYFENEAQYETTDANEEIKKENLKIKRFERLKIQGNLMPRQEVIDFSKSLMAVMFSEVDRVYLSEGPRKVEGMDSKERIRYFTAEREKLRSTLEKQLKNIENEEGEK